MERRDFEVSSVVGGRWSVVDGRWSVVGGRWSVVGGRWKFARINYI